MERGTQRRYVREGRAVLVPFKDCSLEILSKFDI
jgi:hypothetical protein